MGEVSDFLQEFEAGSMGNPKRKLKARDKLEPEAVDFRLTGPGVYFLYWNERLRYIGESTMLMKRIPDHLTGRGKSTPKIKFNRFKVIYCQVGELHALERRAIMLFNPELNVGVNGGDLKFSFKEQGIDIKAIISEHMRERNASRSWRRF